MSGKTLNPELIGDNQLLEFVTALGFWDGSADEHGACTWGSIDESLVDRIQIRLVQSGYEAKKQIRAFTNPNHNTFYFLRIKANRRLRLRKEIDETSYAYSGLVGCVTVPAGFILVRSPEGQTFVTGNCSLEPSITAHFSKDPHYRYATYDGIGKKPFINEHGVLMIDDVYLMTASQFPGMKESVLEFFSDPANCELWVRDADACKAHKALKTPRKNAKPACLGLGYGMGPKKFVNQCYDIGIPMDLATAKEMYRAYWKLFNGIKGLTNTLEAAFKQKGFFINPFGYRLTTEPHKAFNAVIQSSASGVVDLITLEFFKRMPDALFICLVHDEYIYEISQNRVEEARKIKDECVAWLNEQLKWEVPMRLDFTIANNFAEIK